jgi:integrase
MSTPQSGKRYMLFRDSDGKQYHFEMPVEMHTGICKVCNRNVNSGEIRKTCHHHVLYDSNNPLKYTLELCSGCHSQYHRLSGKPGELIRQRIKDLVIEIWGDFPEQFTLQQRKCKVIPLKKTFRSYTERALSETEYKLLLNACERYEDTCLLYLGVRFGLRRLDIVNVKVADINIESGKLRFYEQKKSRTRELPIPSDILPWFKQYMDHLPKTQKTVFSYHDDKTVYNRLQDLCKKAGIRTPFPVHSLRGTCYKRLRNQDKWSLEAASAWLGDTIQVAALHYGAVSEGELADLVKGEVKE